MYMNDCPICCKTWRNKFVMPILISSHNNIFKKIYFVHFQMFVGKKLLLWIIDVSDEESSPFRNVISKYEFLNKSKRENEIEYT